MSGAGQGDIQEAGAVLYKMYAIWQHGWICYWSPVASLFPTSQHLLRSWSATRQDAIVTHHQSVCREALLLLSLLAQSTEKSAV